MAKMSDGCSPKSRRVNAVTFCSWSDGDGERSGPVGTAGDKSKGCGHLLSPNFEVIGGLLYRKKLERGFINYREVLQDDRRHEAVSTFHCRRPGQQHLSLEETYKSVAENYWWEGMYFQIRNFVLSCQQCQSHTAKKNKESSGRGCVSKTMASHSTDILDKLRNQREAGLFCDITLRTNGRSFSAHKAVLAAVSDHFQEIFMEMDSSMEADVDLTGFSEDNLLSLLDFSYSSTLCVRWEDLPEVITMARHLGMWPAVEACSALMKEELQHTGKGFNLACAGAYREHLHQQKESKKKRVPDEDVIQDGFSLLLDVSGESLEGSPRRNLRRKAQSAHNGLPMSPSHRIRLMDFKSPSTKKPVTPRHTIASLQPQKFSPIPSPNTRLLRSTPGAAKEVQRLLPMSESQRPNKKTRPVALHKGSSRARQSTACSPVRIKQEVVEVGEDEEDYARAQEKYKLMNVLGLQRTALLPRPEDLIGWRQKKRLRKLKVNNYSLTKRRKPQTNAPPLPYGAMTLSLPLCIPANTRLLNTQGRVKPVVKVGTEKITAKKPRAPLRVPPTDRSMRSKGVLPDLFQPGARSPYGARQLRRSVRMEDRSLPSSHQPRRRNTPRPPIRNTVRIKSEPVEHTISGFSSDSLCGNASCRSPPSQRVQARKNGSDAAVKTLRYNSGRPATKPKLKQASAKQAEETKCKPREEGRKVESQRLKGVEDTRLGFNDSSESSGLQFSEHGPPPSIYSHPLYKVIKEEPADPVPVGGPFPDPPSPDLGKRQSKPPIKLLDSGFLFSFCRSAGGPMAAIKKEEESVDICLTRSVSQVGRRFGSEEPPPPPHRALRNRGPPILPVVKKEKKERKVSHNRYQRPRGRPRNDTLDESAATPVTQITPKQKGKVLAVSSRNCVTLDAARRARLRQLRGPRSQAPTAPKSSHTCLECPAVYKDCDALIMHRLRHVDGKHWPCPLCSKTFFRLRNVRNHIRNHDPKLYKCRSCIAAGS